MSKHDLIHIERTGRWVCKCGKSGYLSSDANKHQIEIDNELEIDRVQKERIDNLLKEVDKVEEVK